MTVSVRSAELTSKPLRSKIANRLYRTSSEIVDLNFYTVMPPMRLKWFSTNKEHLPISGGLGPAILLMVGAAFSFSCMNAFAKMASATLPSTEVAFARTFVNILFLAPWMAINRVSFLGTRRKLLLTRSLSGATSLIFNFSAASKIPLADLGALLKTGVLFTVLLGFLVLKEKFSLRRMVYVLIGFAGALVVMKPTFEIDPQGGLEALGSAFFGSISAISIRELRGTERAATVVFQFCAYASLILLVLFGARFEWPEGREWIYLGCVGLAGMFGQVAVTSALLRAPASIVAPYSFSEVLFAATLGIVFMGESLSWVTIVGALIIVFSGVLLGRNAMRS